MIRLFFIIGLGLMCLVLAACSITAPSDTLLSDPSVKEAMGRMAIVTVGSPRLDSAKPTSISWLARLDVVGEHETLSTEELRQYLTGAISGQIMNKGYPVIPQDGDFQLYAVVILEDKPDESFLLQESGGMDPGLAGSETVSGKGTLVLELKQGRVTRWKGTVQIYIAPQFDRQVALQRIEAAIAQLLSTWP